LIWGRENAEPRGIPSGDDGSGASRTEARDHLNRMRLVWHSREVLGIGVATVVPKIDRVL